MGMSVGERIKQSRKKLGLTQDALAKLVEMDQSTLSDLERGKSAGTSYIASFAKYLKINPYWLETGKGTPSPSQDENKEINLVNNPEYPAIRRVKLSLSAGISGFSIEMPEEDHSPLVFGKKWYKDNNYRPDKLVAIKVKGESMQPGMSNGDTVVINSEDTHLVDGVVFAVNYEGEAVIKRMVRDAGEWWLSSDNPDQRRYPRKLCAGDACIIIGRIVHKQSESI